MDNLHMQEMDNLHSPTNGQSAQPPNGQSTQPQKWTVIVFQGKPGSPQNERMRNKWTICTASQMDNLHSLQMDNLHSLTNGQSAHAGNGQSAHAGNAQSAHADIPLHRGALGENGLQNTKVRYCAKE